MKSYELVFEEPVKRSRTVIIETMVVLAVISGLIAMTSTISPSALLFMVFLAVCVLVPAILMMPWKVGVRDGQLYITRLMGPKIIPLDRIKDVRIFHTMMNDGRIAAVSGLMGTIGWYKSWEIGLYFAYIGNFSQTFLVELKEDEKGRLRKYVLSCNNNREAVEKLRKCLGLNPQI